MTVSHLFWVHSSVSLLGAFEQIKENDLQPANTYFVTTQSVAWFQQAWQDLTGTNPSKTTPTLATEQGWHYLPEHLLSLASLSLVDYTANHLVALWLQQRRDWQLQSQQLHCYLAQSFLSQADLLQLTESLFCWLASNVDQRLSQRNAIAAKLMILEDEVVSYSPSANEALLVTLHYLLRKYQFNALNPDGLPVATQYLLGVTPTKIATLEASVGAKFDQAPQHQQATGAVANNTLYVANRYDDSPVGSVFGDYLQVVVGKHFTDPKYPQLEEQLLYPHEQLVASMLQQLHEQDVLEQEFSLTTPAVTATDTSVANNLAAQVPSMQGVVTTPSVPVNQVMGTAASGKQATVASALAWSGGR